MWEFKVQVDHTLAANKLKRNRFLFFSHEKHKNPILNCFHYIMQYIPIFRICNNNN